MTHFWLGLYYYHYICRVNERLATYCDLEISKQNRFYINYAQNVLTPVASFRVI